MCIGPLKTVAVYVEDQESALDFYVRKLGFELRRRMQMGSGANWLEVAPPDAESALVIYPRAMMPDWAAKTASLVFHCANITATINTLRERGVTVCMEPTDMPWGKFAAIEDLDGNQIGLTEQSLA